ncbi:MAG: hypothetical protein GEEBNDBF_00174 [bacterium]|nr:hypothetical protein [bacterium]
MTRSLSLGLMLCAILGLCTVGQQRTSGLVLAHAEIPDPGYTSRAESQALALALMMHDYGELRHATGPTDPTFNLAPYWPLDTHGKFWRQGEDSDIIPGEPLVLRRHSWLYTYVLPDGTTFSPWEITQYAGFVPAGEEPPLYNIPVDAFRARTLLRPVQAWVVAHPGAAVPSLDEICHGLGLALNPSYLGEVAGAFDQIRVLQFAEDSWRQGLFLSVGERSWLWEIDRLPAMQMGGVTLKLTTDGEAMRRAAQGRESESALRQLTTSAAANRLAWMDRKHQVTLDSRRETLENRAKLTLRALGSSQLAYQDQNLNRHYGSYAALVAHDYIQHGYTRRNLINLYSLAVFYASPARMVNGQLGEPSRFTIVALPQAPGLGLRTFSISEDQTVRVATDFSLNIVPNRGNNVPTGDDPRHWEPLR